MSQDIGRLTYTVAPSEPNANGGGKGTPLVKIDMGMVSERACSSGWTDSMRVPNQSARCDADVLRLSLFLLPSTV